MSGQGLHVDAAALQHELRTPSEKNLSLSMDEKLLCRLAPNAVDEHHRLGKGLVHLLYVVLGATMQDVGEQALWAKS